jgi:PKD domain/Bacterial SH3 domain
VNGAVSALAVSGSDMYAGGSFTTAGGVSANYIAKWNGSSWSALGSGLNAWVSALAVSGSDVYAGGVYTIAGGVSANQIAKWNGSSWGTLGSGISDWGVRALVVSGSDVYVGGVFTTAGGVSANQIAKWNGSSWSALGSGMNSSVLALAVSGNDLYGGGAFTTAGGKVSAYLARANISGRVPLVQTLPASSVTSTSARLNGFTDPGGTNAGAQFEFGTTQYYGSSTPLLNIGTNAQDFSFTLSGLSSGSAYHFRIVAANGSGTNRGNDRTFTTLPISTTATQAWVSGTAGLGLRFRASPGLSANVLAVMPEGSVVALLGDTLNADGYLWRRIRFSAQEGWAAAQYLVFAPTGTPPVPPSAPTGLTQRRADGSGSISGGGTVTSPTVALAATVVGAAGEQFKLQVDVRPSATGFSAPTHESGFVRGGAQAAITVSGLSNQGYHWRVRVLDGDGVASAWVPFSGNAADFVVDATKPPVALFNWSPAHVFTDEAVQFTAEASGGTGLTFNWDFGDQTMSGAAVTRTFTSAGELTVRLTITDSLGRQAEHTEIISVVGKEIVVRINNLAQRTATMLDQVLSHAQQAAGAADYFHEGVSAAENKILLNAVFSLMGQGIGLADYKNWIKVAAGFDEAEQGFLTDVWSEFVSYCSGEILESANAGNSYSDIFIPHLQSFIQQKKAGIELLRQEAIAAAGALTPAHAEQLARNLQGRSEGNFALKDSYATKVNLPVTFRDLKETYEDSLRYQAGEILFNIGVSAGIAAATGGIGALGGSAGLMTTVGSVASLERTALDQLMILSEQSVDAQMLAWSLSALAQGTYVAGQMAANTENGLKAVRDMQMPPTPAGRITVEHKTQGGIRQFWYEGRWVPKSAYALFTIENTGSHAATYRIEAVFPKIFTIVSIYDVLKQKQKIPVASHADNIVLGPGEQVEGKIYFL